MQVTYETKFNLQLDFVAPNCLNYFGILDFGPSLKKKKSELLSLTNNGIQAPELLG